MRRAAARDFLENLPEPTPGEREEDWDVIKKAIEDDIVAKLPQ